MQLGETHEAFRSILDSRDDFGVHERRSQGGVGAGGIDKRADVQLLEIVAFRHCTCVQRGLYQGTASAVPKENPKFEKGALAPQNRGQECPRHTIKTKTPPSPSA